MNRLLVIVLSGLLIVSLAGWQGGPAQAADPVDTVTTIDSSPDAPEYGDTITVWADVAQPGGGVVSYGEVDFDAAPTKASLWNEDQSQADVRFAGGSLTFAAEGVELALDSGILPFLSEESDGFWLSAQYDPEVVSDEFNPSLSDPLYVDLSGEAPEPVATTTTVTGPASAVVGQATWLTAEVSPAEAEGVVEFSVDGVPVGSPVALVDGEASLSYTYAFAGVSTVRAIFTPSDPAEFDESEDLSGVTVTDPPWPGPVATITAVTGPASAAVGVPATLVASMSPASAAGTVQFSVDGSPVGSPVTVAAGAASIQHTFESEGASTVQATFTPANSFAYLGSAGSAGVTVSAAVEETTTEVTGPVDVKVDLPTALTASVTPTAAAGTVQFSVGGVSVGEPVPVNGGAASLTHAFSMIGASWVRATFTPTEPDMYGPSLDSDGLQVMVDPGGNSIEVTGPDSATAGEETTLTATVQPADATGTVTFLADGSEVATVELAGGEASVGHTFEAAGESSVIATFAPATDSHGPTTSAVHTVTVEEGASSEWWEQPYHGVTVSGGRGCKAATGAPAARMAAGPDDFFWPGQLPDDAPFYPNVFTFSPFSLIPGFIKPLFGWFMQVNFEACIFGLSVSIGPFGRAKETPTLVTGTVQCVPTATGYACPFDFPKFEAISFSADVPLPAAFGGQEVNVESRLTSTDPATGETTTLLSDDDVFQVPKRTALTAKLAPVKSGLTSVKRGKSVTYQVRVRNAGVVTAKGVRTCVSLGKGAKVMVAKGAEVRGRQACWTVPSLKGDKSLTRTLTLRAPTKSGPLKITANVTPKKTQADPVRLVAMLNVR